MTPQSLEKSCYSKVSINRHTLRTWIINYSQQPVCRWASNGRCYRTSTDSKIGSDAQIWPHLLMTSLSFPWSLACSDNLRYLFCCWFKNDNHKSIQGVININTSVHVWICPSAFNFCLSNGYKIVPARWHPASLSHQISEQTFIEWKNYDVSEHIEINTAKISRCWVRNIPR